MKRSVFTLLCLIALTSAHSQSTAERAEDIFARLFAIRPAPSAGRVQPAGDGKYYYQAVRGGGIVCRSFAESEVCDTLMPAGTVSQLNDFQFSAQGKILVADGSSPIYRHSYTTDYALWNGRELTPVAPEIGNKRDASFSPDGRLIAFSSGNDLWLCDTQTAAVQRVTYDGRWNYIINGTTDWVYEEEYGFTRAYAFSPDSRKIAYLRFDESRVPMFAMMRYDGELYNRAYEFKYPKAGDTNSTVTLHLYDIASGTTRRIDTGTETDQYIPHIGWTPAGDLYFYRTNRRQNTFEVIVDRDGRQQSVYCEQSPRYVERPSAATVQFVDGDRFIVREESSAGWWHLYLYSIEHGLIRQLTQGEWEVTQLVGFNDRYVWYVSTERSPMQRDLYRIGMDGSGKRRLTEGEGWHAIRPDGGEDGVLYYIDTYSSASTTGSVTVHDGDGVLIRTIAEGKETVDKPRREFFTWTTERGDTLNAYMIRPRDFDPSKRYPVLLSQYSGPGSQEVSDRWTSDWCDLLAGEGYIIAVTDGRGTGYRGEAFKKQTYADLGRRETEDQISFARYMASQPYADPDRIGIYGWSYGGFMALSCALKGDGLFKVAIAVAPVTSWRFYDSVYTETYNGLPDDNPAGYDENSPLNFSEKLSPRTRLLMIHGTADDNVHFQNSMEMARRLNSQGAQYDMMVYPDQNHSMMPSDMVNVRVKMIAYILEHL